MQSRDHLDLLIQELASHKTLPALLLPLGPDSWIMQAGPGLAVELEWADLPSRLVLSVRLGCAGGRQTMAVYETLLSYNLLWRETGGVKMALEPAARELRLLFELPLKHCDAGDLAAVLDNFIGLAVVWRTYVQRFADGAATDQAAVFSADAPGAPIHGWQVETLHRRA